MRLACGALLRLLDALAFSGLWVAAAAPALVVATSFAFGATPAPTPLLFVFSGTYAVYGLDRLRDRATDVDSAPIRTAFVERHRSALLVATLVAGATAAVCTFALGMRGFAIAAVAGGVGALHRRLKRLIPVKGIYIAADHASWLVVGSAPNDAPPSTTTNQIAAM